MSTILVDMLSDWVRYELKNDEVFDSTIWTNIYFKIEGLNETISKRVGKEVDVSKYLNVLEDEFFKDDNCVYWWKKFPPKSVIIIDEVHFYLGKKVEYGSLDLESELINWISTHRHGQQEIYFLSQHTDQFANQILGIADKLLEIVNVKSLNIPFPINVPMADFDELKKSFGIKTQYYQANIGNFRGKAVKWSGATSRHMMVDDIYRVYKSHDAGVEESDRPELKMTPIEGILWFGRRHAWHLIPKFSCIPLLFFVVLPMFFSLPELLVSGMINVEGKNEKTVSKQEELPVKPPSSAQASKLKEPEVEQAVPLPKAVPAAPPPPAAVPSAPVKVEPQSLKIVMLFGNGVLLDDGQKVFIGDSFLHEGKREVLQSVDVVSGMVLFSSGRFFRF
jgi:hypothetical protein